MSSVRRIVGTRKRELRRWLAPLLLVAGALHCGDTVFAGGLGSESQVGVSGEYSSNPYYDSEGARSATSEAVFANLPLNYTGAEQVLDLTPRFRLGEAQGAPALLTDYEYLDGDYTLTDERNVLSLSAGWHHDSTIYNTYEVGALNGGHNIYRREELATASFERLIGETSDIQLQSSVDRLNYDAHALAFLQSYEYEQGALQIDHSLTARWKAFATAGIGRYRSLDANYHSDNRYAQVGVIRALSETWQLQAQVGYSELSDHAVVTECPLPVIYCELGLVAPVTANELTRKAAGNGALTFERRTERWDIQVAGSRAVQPSGLGSLITLDDAALSATYALSERWSLNGRAHASRVANSIEQSAIGNRRYGDLTLGATWRATEHWNLQCQASVTRVLYTPTAVVPDAFVPTAGSANRVIFLNAYRQFGRINFDRSHP